MSDSSTILYIEDDALNRRLVQRILEPLGYRVLMAEDGMTGIEKAQSSMPDLILMDINLPDIDGLGATVKLRSIPALAHVPIVAVTAGGVDRARERSLTMGCSGFITKPIDLATFPKRIQDFLNGYRESPRGVVGRDTAELFIRDESVALVSRLEEKIRDLTIAKRDLEAANQALELAFDELKKAHEAERELHKAKSDFIAVSSHELRTPLAVVSGYLDLVVSGHLGEPEEEMLRVLTVAQRNTLRLSGIVSALSEVARLESSGLELSRSAVLVEEILEELVVDLTPALQMRKIELEGEYADPRETAWGDRDRLHALFQGLLMNSVRYTPDGGRIWVSTRVDDDDIEVRIKDNGIGIAPENRERIFQPFFRIQDSLHHSSGTFEFQSGGIGLGLTLARGIVDAHHGTVRAESPGLSEGATFVVTLPRRPRD